MVEIPGDLDSDRAKDLIKRARQLRHDAGIGMNQMSDRVGVSKATLHAWETNPPAGLGRSRRTWGRPEFWVACLAVLDEDPDGSGHPWPSGVTSPRNVSG